MKNKLFSKYYLLSCVGVLIASCYPLSMGVSVITDMMANGTVFKENYPKYIIPYTPICLAVLIGVCIMPLCIKLFKQFALVGGSVLAPLSAALMTAFFIILGVTAGVYAGSFLLGKSDFVSIWIPALIASMMTLLMYVGEMILLHGHLYSLGTGFIFDSIPGIVLAPVDLVVIVVSGCVVALIFALLNRTGVDGKIN